MTGIYESLEREEAADLVKKYGGRISTSLSKKTNYIVAGEEAGLAKLAKADEMHIPILSEDDLLNLIRKNSGIPVNKSVVKQENGAADKKSPKKEAPSSTIVRSSPPVKKETSKSPIKKETVAVAKPEIKKEVPLSPPMKKSSKSPTKTDLRDKMEDLKIDRPVTEYQKDIASVANQAWVEKYKPIKSKEIIGQQGAASNCVK